MWMRMGIRSLKFPLSKFSFKERIGKFEIGDIGVGRRIGARSRICEPGQNVNLGRRRDMYKSWGLVDNIKEEFKSEYVAVRTLS